MGFTKWFARKGAVGATARWAAKAYRMAKQLRPSLADSDVFHILMTQRFSMFPNAAHTQRALNEIAEVENLLDFVVLVLDIEANFYQNSSECRQIFLEVIIEELIDQGIPSTTIYSF